MKQIMLFLCAVILLFPLATKANAQITNTEYPAAFVQSINSQYVNVNEADQYLDKDTPANKMGEGGLNLATSWTEVPGQMVEESGKTNVVVGSIIGFGKGLVFGLARGLAGALDMATFGIPPYDKPLVKPEYQSENPDQGLKVSVLNW